MKRGIGIIFSFFGFLFFFAGLYVLPMGSDIYLYFFIEIVAKGDWLLGDILANIFALGLIAFGLILIRIGKKEKNKEVSK